MFCRIDRYDELVEEILDQLPTEVWTSATTRFLDPAMASGQFVWSIEKRLKQAGHSDENIRSRVFGFEKNKGYVQLAINMNSLIGTYEVRSYDSLFTWNSDMKFDVIVGNPPYQLPDAKTSGGGHTLWKQFIAKTLTIVNKDGYICLVTPSVPFYNKNDTGDAFKEWQTVCIWTDQSKHFPGVGSTFTSWILQNKPRYKNTRVIDLNKEVNLLSYPWSKIHPDEIESILAKIEKTKEVLGVHNVRDDGAKNAEYSDSESAAHPHQVRWANKQKFKWSNKTTPGYNHDRVMMTFSGYPYFEFFPASYHVSCVPALSGSLLVNNEQEGQRYIAQAQLNINKFERTVTKGSGAFADCKAYSFIKFPLDRDITDSESYAILGLTPDEVKIVEKNAKDFIAKS